MRLKTVSTMALALGMVAAAGCGKGSPDTKVAEPKTPGPAAPVAQAPAADANGASALPRPQNVRDKYRDYVPPKREPLELTLRSMPVAEPPLIDGRASEPFWDKAPVVTTLDYSSQRPITLRSVHVDGEIFFLVTFPEDTPQETHKTWTWDSREEVYREGTDREDVFVFKWSMSGNDVDLRLREPMPHRADIWFWKAHRSNWSGYADDKGQGISTRPSPSSRRIPSRRHGTLYFDRWGDAGKPPWDQRLFFEYKGPTLDQFSPRKPEGSRGDVRAKGAWANGRWTIEFGRKLDTGDKDDVVFKPGAAHLFAVATYAMALDTPHPRWSRPLYRTGDAFDRLFLTLAPGNGR